MKHTVFTRALALLLVVASLASVLIIPAAAATTTAFDILSTSKYAKTYTISSSGRTTPYTSKTLSTRGTVTYGRSNSAYIDNKADELYVFDVGQTNGKYWAYVSYPSGSRRVNAYIPLSAISRNNANHAKTVSTGKFYCSTRENAGNSSSYYVAKGDVVYLLATGTKYQILYPISGGKYRIAYCNPSDYQKYCAPKTNSNTDNTASGWQMPMNNAYCTWRSKENWSWATYTYRSNGRNYHLGLDMYGTGGTVYAAASGTVVGASTSSSGANGRYIIIRHTVSGKTVYSFYAHLKSLNVSVGQTVNKGAKIATAGGSGYGSNSYYGTHLHFAVVDKYLSNGNYYGYAPYFSGNKTTYGGITFYDPRYIINNNRLP